LTIVLLLSFTAFCRSVTGDLYVGDAEKIMRMAMPMLQTDESSGTAIPMDELLSACARIASVMGEEYAPFVGVVLPHLLARISAPPDMQFSVRYDGEDF